MPRAGELRERLTFASPTSAPDGLGNPTEGFTDQFSVWARVQPRLGGEQVLASRLSGRGIYILTVRSSANARRIVPDWQATHSDGRVFQIKSPSRNVDEKNEWLEFDAETGIAA